MFVLAFLALFITVADGQNGLTLERCLALAKEKNLQLKVSETAVRSAELSRSEFLTTTLPQLKLKSEASYAPTSPSFGYDPVVSNNGEGSARFAIEHVFYDAGVRSLKSDQLGIDIQRSTLEHRAVERDLLFAVKEMFVEVLRSQREIELQQESVDQLADYLEVVKRLAKGGIAGSTDVLKTQVQLSGAMIALQKSKASAATAKAALSELIGSSPDTSFTADGSLENVIGAAFGSAVIQQVIDASLTLEARIAELGIQKTSLDVQMAQRERFPTISLFGDAGLWTSIENLQLPRAERLPFIGSMVGLRFELPIFNWGGTGLRIQERELAVDTFRFQSMLLQRSLQTEAQKVRIQLAASRDRLRSLRSSITAAEDNFLLTKSKYVGGGSLSLEVLNAQQLLTETKLSELQTLADIQTLLAKIQQLTTQ